MHQAEVPAIPISIFYSYAHEDTRYQLKIAKQLSVLKRQNHITAFSKRDILPGQEWENEISQKLKTADIILLLVSADFMDSDYCYTEEMALALQRHRAKEARVIPIILSPCEWKESPLGKLNPLPDQGTPVIDWKPQVKAYDDIAKGVRRVVDDVRRRKSRDRVTLHAEQAIEHTHFLKPLPKRTSISPFKGLFLDAVDGLRDVFTKVRNFMVNSFSLGEVGKRAQGSTLLSLFICTILDIFALPYLFYQWLKVAFLYFFIAFGLMFLIGIANKNSTVAYFTTVLFTLLWLMPGLNYPLNDLNTSSPLFWIFIILISLLQLMLFRPYKTRRRTRRIF